jgi:hypothetical protein
VTSSNSIAVPADTTASVSRRSPVILRDQQPS